MKGRLGGFDGMQCCSTRFVVPTWVPILNNAGASFIILTMYVTRECLKLFRIKINSAKTVVHTPLQGDYTVSLVHIVLVSAAASRSPSQIPFCFSENRTIEISQSTHGFISVIVIQEGV